MLELFTQIGSSPWFNVVSSLAGLLIGYRFGIHSERRKEYNELADPLFTKVNQKLEPYAAHWFHIDDTEIEQIRRRMGWLQRMKFDSAIAVYQQASSKCAISDGGESYFTEVNEVNESLRKIARVLQRK